MRKLFAFNMVTLDGFFEGPDHDINWHNVDEEFNEFAVEQTSSVGTLLFGRLTYLLMESYWPTPAALADDPQVAALMNSLPKVVFSKTLRSADWENTTLIKDDAQGEILRLKQQPGKDMAIFGSANLISTIMDVIDEHRVLVSPILLHQGTPLFKPTGEPLKLNLVNVRRFNSGNILLSYQPTRS
jgi:dihydrofolate reductase